MPDKVKNQRLTGLLEYPLKNAFIEFEYSSGDLVGDLNKKIQELWGLPKRRRYGIFDGRRAWAILCQDEGRAGISY